MAAGSWASASDPDSGMSAARRSRAAGRTLGAGLEAALIQRTAIWSGLAEGSSLLVRAHRADNPARASVCSCGRAGCDDGLSEIMPRNARVVVAALTDAVFGEVRLVKVAELSIQQDDRPFPAWPGSVPRGLGHGGAAGAGCGRFAGN